MQRVLQPVANSFALPQRVQTATPLFGARKKAVPLSPLIKNHADSPASDAFVRRVNKAVVALPDYFTQAWMDAGGMVYTGRFMTEMHPDWKDTARDKAEGHTWDTVDGVCEGNEVSLAEFTWQPKKSKPSKFDSGYKHSIERSDFVNKPKIKRRGHDLLKNTRPERVMNHEAGHALDYFFNQAGTEEVSDSKAFKTAYQKDYQALSRKERKERWYFIQPNAKGQPTAEGRDEAFAEAFATLYGGGGEKIRTFRKHFKHSIAFVEQAMTLLQQRMQII